MDTSSASTSSSNAVNPNSNHGYDIFINHRGTDTKKNFASHLYHRFLLYGYQVFLDQKELEEGDYFDSQIKAAIKSASVHVALFFSTICRVTLVSGRTPTDVRDGRCNYPSLL